jgi:hypothetical protein
LLISKGAGQAARLKRTVAGSFKVHNCTAIAGVFNCVAYGFSAGFSSGFSGSHNATDGTTLAGTDGITLSADPFVDSANDDYSIATSSALAATGTNLRTLTTTAKDITGEDRIYWDIGAFAANTAASSYKTEFKVVPTAGTVPATQTDFPMLLDLSDASASFWSTVASGGGDIRVFDEQADGLVELPREVVSCDTTAETGEVWVKAPSLSSSADTVLQVHVDGTSSDYAATATYGRNEVWSDYAAVLHLNDSNYTDVTGNGHDGTANSAPTQTSTLHPWGGTWTQFDGADDYISLANSAALLNGTGTATIQAWTALDGANASSDYGIFGNWTTTSSTEITNFIYRNGSGQDTWRFSVVGAGATGVSAATGLATSVANKLDGTIDGTATTLYQDGSSIGTGDPSTSTFVTDDEFKVGAYYDLSSNRCFDGYIGEVRVLRSALSPEWITTEYANQSSPSTFYAATDPSAGGGTNYDVSVTFGSEGGVTMTGLVGLGADFTVDMSAGIDSSALADASADFTAAAQAGAVIESRADFFVSITTGAEAGQAMTGAVTAGGTVLASLLVSAEIGATATAEAQALASMLTSAQAGQVMSGSVDGVTNIEAAMLAGYDAGASAEAQADALAALLVSYGAGLSAFEDSSIPASMVLSATADMGMAATIGAEVSFITAAETDAVLSGQVDASAVIEVSTQAAATMIASAASSAGIEVASIANIEIFASSFSGDIVTPEHRIYRVSFELRTFSVEPRVSTFTVQ